MQLTQIIAPCHTGWPDPIPIRAIQVGQCSWPTSLLCAIQVGQCSWPNHFSVPYRLAEFDTYPCHTGWPDTIVSVSYRSANALGPNHSPVPYRLAGSDTYPCHTDRPMQLAQSFLRAIQVGRIRYLSVPYGLAGYDPIRVIQVGQCTWTKSFPRAIQVGRIRYLSVPYRSANAGGPNHCSVPYRLAGSDTYLCHTGRPMQLAQIIAPCHTGWPDPIPICAIQVGRIRYLSVPYGLAGYDPIRVIQVGQCTWTKSFPVPYRLAGSNTYPCHTDRPMQVAQTIAPCHTGWPDPIPIRAIQVGQCSWPKSLLRAIQVGQIRYLSVPYRSANAVGPNHCSVPYRLSKFDTYPCHTGWPDTFLFVSYRSANALAPNHSPVPYRLAGSDTYPCHTDRPMQVAQIIPPCHTGWPDPIPIRAIQVGQCSRPKSLLRAIQVVQIRYLSVPYGLAGYVPIRVIQVGQCTWTKSFPRAIQVGRIRYLSVPYRSANAVGPNHCSVPYRLAGSDTYLCHTGWPNSIPIRAIRVGRIRSYPCHTGRPMHLDQIIPRAIQVGRIQYLSMPYRSANAGGPNHCSVPYRVAGSDTYPCHTGRPMHLAQIIPPCHTGWPDPIPIRAIQVGQCSWPKSLLRAIQVGQIRYLSVPYGLAGYDPIRVIQVGQCSWPKSFLRAIPVGRIRYLSMPYRWANAVGPNNFSVPYRSAGSDTYPCIQVGQCSSLIIAPCHTGWPDPIPIHAIQVGQCS